MTDLSTIAPPSERLPDDLERLAEKLPPYLTLKEAMEVRKCRRSTFYRLLAGGRVIALKDGRRLRIVTSSLLADMAALPRATFRG